MAIDFNTAPYYDDFTESSNYYRILFKPGRAVQARELTQLQSALQNQIAQFGKNIFKDGTKILDASSFIDTNGKHIKVQETTDLSNFENQIIVGATSGARAKVLKFTPQQIVNIPGSSVSTQTINPALHFVYLNGVGDFIEGETISIEDTLTSVTALPDKNIYLGGTTFFHIDQGVFFIKNNFVFCPKQTIVVSPSLTYPASARIGLKVEEGILTSDEDETLLDPAIGTNNYFAPGADRYYINLILSSIEYDPAVEDSDAIAIDEFVEIANIRNGSVISKKSNTEYADLEDSFARRTYDESGDYTVNPFIAKVDNHLYGNISQLSLIVSPGKAYVKGYEFETIAPTNLRLDRARDTESVNGYGLALDYARYVPVNNTAGYFNFTESQLVTIHKVVSSAANVTNNTVFEATQIGTARVRNLVYDEADTYNLYLFDININTGNTFSEANSFIVANTISNTVICKADVENLGNAALTYGVDDTFLFKFPQNNIETLLSDAGVSDTIVETKRAFTNVSFVPGTGIYGAGTGNSIATISVTGNDTFIGSGILSNTAAKARFYAVVTSSSGTPSVGTVLNFNTGYGEVDVSGQNAYLRTRQSNTTFTANVVALVSRAVAQAKIKNLANTSVVATFANVGNVLSSFSLGYSDVVKINSITDARSNSWLSSYALDTGQRDDYYDHASISLKPGATGPELDSVNNPNVTINFQYFTHTGSGFFSVDSYTQGGIDWGDIPTYRKSNGENVRLSDVIDFRAVRQNNSNLFISGQIPTPESTLNADFNYYLPRKDKLVLTKEKKLTVVKGIPNKSPSYPSDLSDGMTLYTIDLPAYTKSPADVKLNYVNNRRFTMRDIGKIEKRVDRLEYYTALSFLEKIAADQRIESTIPGIDRFKNGILVDAFAGHSISDVNNGDLACAIDFERRLLRPRFASESYLYSDNFNESDPYAKKLDLITLDYVEEPLISQTKATTAISTVPFDVFTWDGIITLSPATDVWADTITNPDVTVNLNGENDAFTQIVLDNNGLTPWGTRWDDWRTVFRGLVDVGVDVSVSTVVDAGISVSEDGTISSNPTATTTASTTVTKTYEEGQARAGLEYYSQAKTISTRLGEKVIDSSIIPYIRSKPITFVGRNLKPDTPLFATFDGQNVTDYCIKVAKIQFASANVLPANLTTLAVGTYAGGSIIHQRANVAYVLLDTTKNPPAVGNVATLTTSSATTTTGNVLFIDTDTDLKTDSAGDIAGVFVIPNNDILKFNLGERAFRLVDNLDKRFVTTAGETKYLAYGLSQTKQDTILATRMNLVNIQPRLETRQGNRSESVSTSVSAPVTTKGVVSEATLPPPADTSQTLFCGESIRTTGQIGVHHFRVNLGSSGVGPGNIICSSGIIPDRFTLTYNGNVSTTEFMSAGGSAVGSTYNPRLKNLGYPEIQKYNSSTVRLPFLKQNDGVEYATVKVEAPLQDTAWRFEVECPTGTTNPAPGTARLTASITTLPFIIFENDAQRGWTVQSAETDMSIRFVITNTANNPRWTKTGIDKTINITSITLDTSGLTTNEGVSFFELTGVSRGHRPGLYFPGTTDTFYNNTLGTLPVLLQPGESRVFTLRVQKAVAERIIGRAVVRVGITGPGTGGTQPVSCNDIVLDCTTSPPPAPVVANDGGGGDGGGDPLAQTFLVNPRQYPNGVFISSADLWFYSKSNNVPVFVELRPVVNGYPSSFDIIPFGIGVNDPEDVTASTTFNKNNYTRFFFQAPIYLAPGRYALVVRANSTDYYTYAAAIGEFELDNPASRITVQPYIESLFAAQNAATWTADQTKDLTFRLNKCKFTTGNEQTAQLILDANAPTHNVEYDLFFTGGEILEFAETPLSFGFKSTSETTGSSDSAYRNYLLNSNYTMEERKVLKGGTGESLRFNVTMSTEDENISPVIDLERLSSVLVRNIINDPENESPPRTLGEDDYSGGNASARYITRRVTLAPGFEAQDLRVYINAFCPSPSRVKVFYKVNAPGTTDFDTQNKYIEMTASAVSGDTRTGFAEYTFTTANGTCLPAGELFNIFTIKIVMLSTDTTRVPIIRDLRVLALDVE